MTRATAARAVFGAPGGCRPGYCTLLTRRSSLTSATAARRATLGTAVLAYRTLLTRCFS